MPTAPADDRIVTVAVSPDDPRAQPLLTDLLAEYDHRYGDLFGDAVQEMERYPTAEFLPSAGVFLLLRRRAVAGDAGAGPAVLVRGAAMTRT